MMKLNSDHTRGILQALAAAALFGLSTPLAKTLVGTMAPLLLAGLLYAGSGLGLALWMLLRKLRRQPAAEAPLVRRDVPWLAGAVLFGGVLGPILLMLGLARTPASTASLLLNLESVLTAVLAWVVFRENVDRRVFLGMLAIVAGSVLLSWQRQSGSEVPWGALAIAGACLCWAIDNNLTRPVSSGDPVQIAAIKGGVAGVINVIAALVMGYRFPDVLPLLATGLLGFVGYGLSLVLFVLALRSLGTARTGAYFSTAPFVGAALSLLLFAEHPTLTFWLAGALMALGVWLHISERHAHEHAHEALGHNHRHYHDEHHQHTHDVPWDGEQPHTHPHVHDPLVHSHPHYPDIHHRHRHAEGHSTSSKQHWETVYQTKAPNAVSWYRPHLDTSLALIEKTLPDRDAAIIDIGGGEATLVDDLLARGYSHLSVLDISPAAIAVARQRLGATAAQVTWLADDLLQASLPPQHFNLWHDRAVFHFLTDAEQRAQYVQQLTHALKPGGHAIIATFGPQGPQKCSGLDVVRYDAASLLQALGPQFELIESVAERHHTPFGTTQQFNYCHCRLA